MKRKTDFSKKCIIYDKMQLENYLKDLQIVGSLSGLFSESAVPYIYYRISEKLYCASFNADDLSRADIAIDAKYQTKGIGIKTFIESNQNTFQKVAEFNSQFEKYSPLSIEEKVGKIAELRNLRIEFAKNAYGIKEVLYHCIVRNEDGFYLFEEIMNNIDIDSIKITGYKKGSIYFKDKHEEYIFNQSKSTLYKRFSTKEYFEYVKIDIFEDPMKELRKLQLPTTSISVPEYIIIPLYSENAKGKFVGEKSGLNQWNASGRKRNLGEVYIPFPAHIRNVFDTFFPSRNTPFDVTLPNGRIISMKICQQNGKAIMSNPNKDLGEWLLREVLNLQEGQILTYDMLLSIGIDCVYFEKLDGKYKLDFRKIGEYEKFLEKELLPDI